MLGLNMFFLVVMALLLGWVPLLGPALLGFLAARSQPGARALLAVLPALGVQTVGLLIARWTEQTLQARQLDGWLWTAVGWIFSPVSTLLGRPLGHLIGGSSPLAFAALFTLPVLLGLLLGAVTGRRPLGRS
jgi:hypothetical protein